MRITYAVTWQETGAPPKSGRLEFGLEALALEGANGGEPVRLEVPYGDVASFQPARESADRLGGRPTLVLRLRTGGTLRIASVAQSGVVGELTHRLSERVAARRVDRAVLVVPLKPGTRDRVADLLAHGPPFDPAEMALDRHEVFLTDTEAVFVFEGASADFLERLATDEALPPAADAWRPYVLGTVRYADEAYAWTR